MPADVPQNAGKHRDAATDVVVAAMRRLVLPGGGYIGCAEILATAVGVAGAALGELRSLPLGNTGQRLMALRYLIENGDIWLTHYAWQKPLARLAEHAPAQVEELWERIKTLREQLPDEDLWQEEFQHLSPQAITDHCEGDLLADGALRLLLGLSRFADARRTIRRRLYRDSSIFLSASHRTIDLMYLLSQPLEQFPATTVGEGKLEYIIIADKGEMGVRATREAIASGAIPVVVHSKTDDARALQVRLAEEVGGFAVPLEGSFRETYGNPLTIAERVTTVYREQFGEHAEEKLRRSALYPGYGPLAENTQAIEHFRRSGIVFIGPSQDVVEKAGDKRRFRLLTQEIDREAVTPGIVIDETDRTAICHAIEEGYRAGRFMFPGRLKAANGGGGRGQVVIGSPEEVSRAVAKVLDEIQAMGWDPGLLFEQNIDRTTHLEVQILRDRYGNTRHFGMRDCSEQRASQKIQEEAPPAILQDKPELERRMCDIAVQLADEVEYVGACTVELMYRDGKFYLLEMNTRIQVEHPVTEEAHRVCRGNELAPLNLVQLQFAVARGERLDFAQEDVVCTHVAREFRINAESYAPDVKDPRDGKRGLFLPNAGIFDVISLPTKERVQTALAENGITGIRDLSIRFDCGFEVGDDLVNKDPTFGKLIVSVRAEDDQVAQRYELLRLASIEVLRATRIEGRQLTPSRKILEEHPFRTNLTDHVRILQSEMLVQHSEGRAAGRHVGWVLDMLRAHDQAMAALAGVESTSARASSSEAR